MIIRLKREGFKDKTIQSIKSIYLNYKKFVIRKYNFTNLLVENNDYKDLGFNENFYSRKLIEEYINSLSFNKTGTKKKKMYILSKTLLQLKTG